MQERARWHGSPDGKWIAFDSNLEGRPAIYVMPPSGGSPRRLTNDLVDFNIPTWSRDGRFVYTAVKVNGKFEVGRIPAAGGRYTQITHGGGTSSQESVDGRDIYYNRRVRETWSLRRCDRDGGHDEEILPSIQDRAFAVVADGVYYSPLPEPDGRSSIRFLKFSTGEISTITTIQKPQRRPIVVGPGGGYLLFSQFDHWGRDLMLLSGLK